MKISNESMSHLLLYQRRLVTLLHARRCANRAIHGRFNPVQPAESADHNLRTSTTIPTDVIRNVPSINKSIRDQPPLLLYMHYLPSTTVPGIGNGSRERIATEHLIACTLHYAVTAT